MATMTTAQKNELVKTSALGALTLPDGTVQYGDFKFAIPVTVDGEERWAKLEMTSASNKDTKTTKAFDPHAAREAWQSDKELAAAKAAEVAAARAKKSK